MFLVYSLDSLASLLSLSLTTKFVNVVTH